MRLRRIVYATQLVVPFVMPWIFFLARTWLGAPAGWLPGVGLIMLGPAMTIALGIPVLISLRDRDAYRAKAASASYTYATLTVWGALLVAAIVIPEVGLEGPSSLIGVWTGGVIDTVTAQYALFLAGVVAVAAWASAVWFAITGLIEARRRAGL